MHGKIVHIHSDIVANWYQSLIYLEGKTAIGFGTTRAKALADSFRDLGIINKLSK